MVEKLEGHFSALQFQCPRCAELHCDDYEMLDIGVPSEWRCSGCERLFTILLTECDYCAAEAIEVALVATELAYVSTLPCPSCGKRSAQHEEAQADIDFG